MTAPFCFGVQESSTNFARESGDNFTVLLANVLLVSALANFLSTFLAGVGVIVILLMSRHFSFVMKTLGAGSTVELFLNVLMNTILMSYKRLLA